MCLAQDPETPDPVRLEAEPSVGGIGKYQDFHPQDVMNLENTECRDI